MFPLRDENRTSHTPWMTWAVMAANLALFGYETWLAYASPAGAYEAFVVTYSFIPARFLAAPGDPAQWFTVLSAMFLHAGWLHIGGNMLYLWIFGDNVEDRMGPWRFLGFYLVCGVAATVAQTLADPTVAVPNLGASGAIAGVLAAYLLLFPRARVITAVFIIFIIELVAMPAWLIIGFWFVIQLGSGLGSLGASAADGGVAYLAHVGGFAAGAVLTVPLWLADRRRYTRGVRWR